MTRSLVPIALLCCLGGMTNYAAEAKQPQVDERPALPFPSGIKPQSICGSTVDFQDVELYDGSRGVSVGYVRDHEPSTVQLQWKDASAIAARLPGYSVGNVGGARWCSGTLISESLVLTAGHCIEVQDGSTGWTSPFTMTANGRIFAPPDVLATLHVVHFGYQLDGATGAVRAPETFPIVRKVEHGIGGLDYAILELGPSAAGKMPTMRPATISVRMPVLQEQLALIQHPQGMPKKIDGGHAWGVFASDVYYDNIDSMGGSSGSAIRDSAGEVIGIHTNGGCTPTSGANRGVTTEAVAGVSAVF